jgi:hypothetical protein
MKTWDQRRNISNCTKIMSIEVKRLKLLHCSLTIFKTFLWLWWQLDQRVFALREAPIEVHYESLRIYHEIYEHYLKVRRINKISRNRKLKSQRNLEIRSNLAWGLNGYPPHRLVSSVSCFILCSITLGNCCLSL